MRLWLLLERRGSLFSRGDEGFIDLYGLNSERDQI